MGYYGVGLGMVLRVRWKELGDYKEKLAKTAYYETFVWAKFVKKRRGEEGTHSNSKVESWKSGWSQILQAILLENQDSDILHCEESTEEDEECEAHLQVASKVLIPRRILFELWSIIWVTKHCLIVYKWSTSIINGVSLLQLAHGILLWHFLRHTNQSLL